MPMTRLRATRGRTTVSPPTAEAVARVGPMPEAEVTWWGGPPLIPRLRMELRRAAWWAASPGADQTRAPGVGTGSGGEIFDSNDLMPSISSSSSCRTYDK